MRVVIENVSKTFVGKAGEHTEALRDISLSNKESEFLVVVGPSGCGKSTLLNIVAGLLPATSGRVVFEGIPDNSRPHTAVVFQEFALFPWRTVERNVAYGPEERGIPRHERQELTRYYLDLVGLTGFEKKYPHQLSGGMKQRVSIARALANDPWLLLMDEPFSALDAQTRTIMQVELSRIYEKTHKTLLYITHNIQEAVFLGDRVVVLSRRPGRVEQIVTIDLPRPRRERIMLEPQFLSYVDRIWGFIRDQAEQALAEGEA